MTSSGRTKARRWMRVAAGFAASNGPQNFLGAPWAEHVLRLAPSPFRERIALRVLSLSPHYFYDSDRQAEAERNRTTREGLVRDVLLHYLDSTAIALDYGCGPGYMAAAVAAHVRQVEAVDVSRGVLACARVLNGLPNIAYETPDEAARRKEPVDIAYSFAVVQHLTDSAFRGVLTMLRRRVRTGGTLLIHFPVADEEWRTEGQWRADSSVRGRAKMRFGLNCFGRSEAEMARLVTQAGFRNTRTQPLAELTSADPDVSRQRLLVASG